MQSTHSSSRDLLVALASAIVLGVFSTLGDWIWAHHISDGSVLPGVVHGVLIFVILALVLGWAAGTKQTLWRLSMSLPLAGLLIAAGFYPLAGVVGYVAALIVTWVGMWLALALLQRWARGAEDTLGRALTRGLVAAAGSGLSFWAISGIWTQPAPEPNYGLRLGYWTFAFFPGFLALLVGQKPCGREIQDRPR